MIKSNKPKKKGLGIALIDYIRNKYANWLTKNNLNCKNRTWSKNKKIIIKTHI